MRNAHHFTDSANWAARSCLCIGQQLRAPTETPRRTNTYTHTEKSAPEADAKRESQKEEQRERKHDYWLTAARQSSHRTSKILDGNTIDQPSQPFFVNRRMFRRNKPSCQMTLLTTYIQRWTATQDTPHPSETASNGVVYGVVVMTSAEECCGDGLPSLLVQLRESWSIQEVGGTGADTHHNRQHHI